jgi:hypothetical protein
MSRRVFVQSAGAVCGFGAGRESLLHGVFSGDCALRPLDRLEGDTAVAAEVPAAWADAEALARRALDECRTKPTCCPASTSRSSSRG